MSILSEIIQKRRFDIENEKRIKSLESVIRDAEKIEARGASFFSALKSGDDISIIAELKKASPSLGIIDNTFNYIQYAKDYEISGVSAISCLTEPNYFLGSDEYLENVARTVNIPVLRKDFIIDEYMIYRAKVIGASAILLIVSALSEKELEGFLKLAHSLALDTLVECHDEEEARIALGSGARIIGVNNRDLRTFKVDISLTERLRPLVPSSLCFVSESGIKTSDDIKRLRELNADAALLGEVFMKAENKQDKFRELMGYGKN